MWAFFLVLAVIGLAGLHIPEFERLFEGAKARVSVAAAHAGDHEAQNITPAIRTICYRVERASSELASIPRPLPGRGAFLQHLNDVLRYLCTVISRRRFVLRIHACAP